MSKEIFTQKPQINQTNSLEVLNKELNSLLESLQPSLDLIFTGANNVVSKIGTIIIKLNGDKKKLCLVEHNKVTDDIENDGNILGIDTYNEVRTKLQNTRTKIPENKWDESMKLAKQQIFKKLGYNQTDSNNNEGFLREFQQFIDEIPEIPGEFINSSRKLQAINFDDLDEDDENDPRLKALEEIHHTLLTSFKLYQQFGKDYIESAKDKQNQTRPKEEIERYQRISRTITGTDGKKFNVIEIEGDGNCFYHAVADQLKSKGIKKYDGTNYTYQDLRDLALNYVRDNTEKEFGNSLKERLQGVTSESHGDLPRNINDITQYINYHNKDGAWADSGMVGALAQTLNTRLRIYANNSPATYNNTGQDEDLTLNFEYTGNHYNSLVSRSSAELLPFERLYPKQSEKITRIFAILDSLERGQKLDQQFQNIANKLGLSQESTDKLKRYLDANNVAKGQTVITTEENIYDYTREDMNSYGKGLAIYGINLDTHFLSINTKDGIMSLPSSDVLVENEPIYICYNAGNLDATDGIHWIAITCVKHGKKITVLYKDSKANSNNTAENIAAIFNQRYQIDIEQGNLEFIKHSAQGEQEDNVSSGPMTINNLEIMAREIKKANNEGKDGVVELIKLFKGEDIGVNFTTQNQVKNIRLAHSLQSKADTKSNAQQDSDIDDLSTIIRKLKLSNNDISMKDGKTFDLVKIEGDGNCFYHAVADQLKMKGIKKGRGENYTYHDLRALALKRIEENRENITQSIQTILLENVLPKNVNNIEEYIDHHSRDGVWADDIIIYSLAEKLNVTLAIYENNELATHNNGCDENHTLNLQYINGNHYNSLVLNDYVTNKKKETELYVHKIDEYYDKLKLREWGVEELKNWSKVHKGKLARHFSNSVESVNKMCEAIAVMDRANELASGGHKLRDTQKVAALLFMQTDTKGHVSQINTGEGKTTIVSVVEALKVMQGYKGHVITSNNVLAAEGVKDKKSFYELLDITIAHNNPDDKYTDGARECYSKDIVYGSITSFQFDYLRDSFEKLETLGGIDFNNIWVMLDEIDSLVIDQGGNIAKLSGPFPGMESLRYVYINIWVALAATEEEVTQEILSKLKIKAEELKDLQINEDEKQWKYERYEDSLRESFLEEIKKKMDDRKDYLINIKILAEHLHQYARDNVGRWIEFAFAAKYQYKENVEYKIAKDKEGENIIIPVDNQNTGVSMKNTILSNGLHQFLQIKHNLCLTYESLTSCYISNLDYVKKYGSKLSGVTGTLGSKPERELLGSVFNLGFSVVPPFKPKQFIQFPGKVSKDDVFINDVAIATLGELIRSEVEENIISEQQKNETIRREKPRAVLILCASISDVEKIRKEIETEAKVSGLTPKIRVYTDEGEAHVTEATVDVYDIIIATNLAGRGTDFKTSTELSLNGGLHVIEAFLPCNKRVEDQGLGRAGRQGNKGSGQIIARLSELDALGIVIDINNIDFDEIIESRNEIESIRINDIAENKVTELEFKGQLFNKFSLQYGELKEKHKIGIGSDVIKWIYVLRDLKEKWAFWLEEQAYTAKTVKTLIKSEGLISSAVEKEYDKFLNKASEIIKGTIQHNPYYSICLAEKYLESSADKAERKKAKEELEHALSISKNSELLYSAYIKLFEIAIEDGGQVLTRYKKALANIFFYPLEEGSPDYKSRAIENLEKAVDSLKIEHDYLEELINGNKKEDSQRKESILASIIVDTKELPSIINSENQGDGSATNLFMKHLQARLVCLAAYKGNIESLIKQIKGVEDNIEKPEDKIGTNDDVIIGTRVPRYLSKLDSQNQLKKIITERSVNELEYVGMSSVYQIKKIHDVHGEVITGAQVQIGGALVLLSTAVVFPFLLPVNGPLAGAMISEGITDIITALIQQGESGFNKKDYIKGKVISYGISIATMGIGALISSTKILTKAMNACRSLATKLRAVKGPFAGICTYLANKLDKIALYLEQMIEKIEFARKTCAEQAKHLCMLKDTKDLTKFQQLQKLAKASDVVMTHGQKITQIVAQAALGAVKGVVISVAIEKIVIAGLNNLMTGLQPVIKEKVNSTVSKRIKEEDKKGIFNKLSNSEIDKAIKQLFETSLEEDIEHVSKEIALGIIRHSSNWKMQLATLAFESILSGIEIAKYTNVICNKFITTLSTLPTISSNDTNNTVQIEAIITQISDQISGILYGKIVAITGKVVVTLPKALYRGYKEHQEKKADEKDIKSMKQKLDHIEVSDDKAKEAGTRCSHDAVAETLGLDKDKGSKQLADASNLGASENGASVEDTRQLFTQNGIEATICTVENAQAQFTKQGSDRGVVCLSNDEGLGHTIPVTMEGNNLMVTGEGGQKIPLDQYQKDNGYSKAELVIPKGVNNSTIESVKHQCNRNRIVKATHNMNYVGQNNDRKFCGNHFINKIKDGIKPKQWYRLSDMIETAEKVKKDEEEINDLEKNLTNSNLSEKEKESLKQQIELIKLNALQPCIQIAEDSKGEGNKLHLCSENVYTISTGIACEQKIKEIPKEYIKDIEVALKTDLKDGESKITKIGEVEYKISKDTQGNVECYWTVQIKNKDSTQEYRATKTEVFNKETGKNEKVTTCFKPIQENINLVNSNIYPNASNQSYYDTIQNLKTVKLTLDQYLQLSHAIIKKEYDKMIGSYPDIKTLPLSIAFSYFSEYFQNGKIHEDHYSAAKNYLKSDKTEKDHDNLMVSRYNRSDRNVTRPALETLIASYPRDSKNSHIILQKMGYKQSDIDKAKKKVIKGFNIYGQEIDIGWINRYFGQYTLEALSYILSLRINDLQIRNRNIKVLPGIFINQAQNNISDLINKISRSNKETFLVPLSLYDKHAVGIMFVAQEDGSGYKAFYLDPENTDIPEGLAYVFREHGYEIEQLSTEGQRYSNCGPEVIENFMLYLTGERLSQEDAIVNNSRLVEQELLSSRGVLETESLTVIDSYSKQDMDIIISNAVHNTQVNSDGYIIGNATRYDLVTPKSIIDGVIVRADLGTAPCDPLIELLSNNNINQDYAEAILGEVSNIDIS